MKFNTITDALKWCIDHPGQKLTDKDGRELWLVLDYENNRPVNFKTNDDGKGEYILSPGDLQFFDLPTLSPKETEPEKSTLNNLAALENWDWFRVTLPNGIGRTKSRLKTEFNAWTDEYYDLQAALTAGWPVEFGRNEA